MIKFVLPIVLIVLVIAGVLGSRFLPRKEISSPQEPVSDLVKSLDKAASDEGVAKSDNAFVELEKLVRQVLVALEVRVTKVEESVQDLTGRVDKLEENSPGIGGSGATPAPTPAPTTAAATSKQSTDYIPMGPGTTSISTDWTIVDYPEVEIDPANFSGYTNMYLEVTFKLLHGNGTGYVRLFNKTDGTAVTNSDVSTSSSSYTSVVSGGFKLVSGKKTYRLQLKSLSGYEVSVQFARIRVDY